MRLAGERGESRKSGMAEVNQDEEVAVLAKGEAGDAEGRA
jgi:hypothetical protein